MARYQAGSAAGAGAGDAFMLAMNTLALANGWTAHDVISAIAGSRDVIYKSTALDATAGNAAFVRLTQTSTIGVDVRVYTDWDTTTHAGMNVTGNTTGSTRLTIQDATFSYFARVCPAAFSFCAKIGAAYNKIYAGFLRRGLDLALSGMTKTTSLYASGVSTMALASDMTGKWTVGQKVQLVNYAHASGNANAANIELMTIASFTSSSVTFTGTTTKAYDSGALVGLNVLPVCVSSQASTTWAGASGCSWFFPTEIDGTRTGATSHNASAGAERTLCTNANDGPSSWGLYGRGDLDIASSTAGKLGTRGRMYSTDFVTRGALQLEDIVTNGPDTFIVLAVTTGIASCMGPQN